jgi:hypothetical protein
LERVIIIAQRSIKAREEITYEDQFPLELDLDSRITCNCGSPFHELEHSRKGFKESGCATYKARWQHAGSH